MEIPNLGDRKFDELMCPNPRCGSNNLHHSSNVKLIDDSIGAAPAPTIHILFTCELCDVTPTLEIRQHKGCTYVGWLGVATISEALMLEGMLV
jgi:hypothetical protein